MFYVLKFIFSEKTLFVIDIFYCKLKKVFGKLNLKEGIFIYEKNSRSSG
jgi:hypothetical protein